MPLLLLVIQSVSLCALALYQWMELLAVQAGRKTLCAISETVNCETVWASAFAKQVEGLIGMPVAALGLVYGLMLVGLSVVLWFRTSQGKSVGFLVAAMRMASAIGVLFCVMFATASLRIGSVCLTCLGTYALVLGVTVVAFTLLPGRALPKADEFRPALLTLSALCVIAFLLVLLPARSLAINPSATASLTTQDLPNFLSQLQPMERRAVADELAQYRVHLAPPGVSRFGRRFFVGPASAPLQITEFTDILCSHCKDLVEVLAALKATDSAEVMSVEPRYFPLDGECNRRMKKSDGTGVRCAGARAQICLEGNPDYWRLREQLFREQQTLTAERVVEIASSGSLSRDNLLACMGHPSTQVKIDEDIEYAIAYELQGTPLLLINQRSVAPVAAFLKALVLAKGNVSDPSFDSLKTP